MAQKTWATSTLTSPERITRIFLPLCIIASIIFLALGVPQTLNGYTTVKTIEGATQSILVGPVASLDSIMQIGTNGGGFYGANAAYPFMNPSPYHERSHDFSDASASHSVNLRFRRNDRQKNANPDHFCGALTFSSDST